MCIKELLFALFEMSKAGFSVGFCRIGVRGINNKTPMKMTSIVTREETATLSVVMIPSSAVPAALRLMERVGRSIIEGGNQ